MLPRALLAVFLAVLPALGGCACPTPPPLAEDPEPGTPPPADEPPPKRADLPDDVVVVAAGSLHTCVALRDGRVRCFGRSTFGDLGYPGVHWYGRTEGQTLALLPDVQLGGPVDQLVAGEHHTCARMRDDRSVRCWGRGNLGALGLGNSRHVGDDEHPAVAGAVPLPGPVRQLAAGDDHTCALLDGGELYCWGFSSSGALGHPGVLRLGDGPSRQVTSLGPVAVGGAVRQVAAGGKRTCAILESGGALRCWGKGAWLDPGRIPPGNSDDFGVAPGETPALALDVPTGGPIRAVVTGWNRTCVTMEEGGRLRCFGPEGWERPGEGSPTIDPADIDLGEPAAAVALGRAHACVLLEGSGQVRCWGDASVGELGAGSRDAFGDSPGETLKAAGNVDLGRKSTGLTAGFSHTCALGKAGELSCWGYGADGNLGNGLALHVGDDLGETPRRVERLLQDLRDGKERRLPSGACPAAPGNETELGAVAKSWFGEDVHAFRMYSKPFVADWSLLVGRGPAGAYFRLVDYSSGGELTPLALSQVAPDHTWTLHLEKPIQEGHRYGLELVEVFAAPESEDPCQRVRQIVEVLTPLRGAHATQLAPGTFLWDTTFSLSPVTSCPPFSRATPPAITGSVAAYDALFAPGAHGFELDPIHAADSRLRGKAPRGTVIRLIDASLPDAPPLAETYVGEEGTFDVPVCPSLLVESSPVAITLVDVPAAPPWWTYDDIHADLFRRGLYSSRAQDLPFIGFMWDRLNILPYVGEPGPR